MTEFFNLEVVGLCSDSFLLCFRIHIA